MGAPGGVSLTTWPPVGARCSSSRPCPALPGARLGPPWQLSLAPGAFWGERGNMSSAPCHGSPPGMGHVPIPCSRPPAASRLAPSGDVWVPGCWAGAAVPAEIRSCGNKRRRYGDTSRPQNFSCAQVVPGRGGHGRSCAHLVTGLMRLVCPKRLGCCLLLLPPLAFQYLEKGAGGAGGFQTQTHPTQTTFPPIRLPPVLDKALGHRRISTILVLARL